MIVVLDAGNTSLKAGEFTVDGTISRKNVYYFNDSPGKAVSLFVNELKLNYGSDLSGIHGIVVCSVKKNFLQYVKNELGLNRGLIYEITHDSKTSIINGYDNPEKLGNDRLAAVEECYSTHGSAIIIDAGTAITVDVVEKSGFYPGGLIIPGIGTSLKVLCIDANLPTDIELTEVVDLIGKNTYSGIRAGIFYGWGAMMEGVCSKIRLLYGSEMKIVVTGGYGLFLAASMSFKVINEPDLVLKGSLRIFNNR